MHAVWILIWALVCLPSLSYSQLSTVNEIKLVSLSITPIRADVDNAEAEISFKISAQSEKPGRISANLFLYLSPSASGSAQCEYDSRLASSCTATYKIPRYGPSGTWSVYSISLYGSISEPSVYGYYDFNAINQLGLPTEFIITGKNSDNEPPVLKSISFSPNPIDTSAGRAKLSITINAEDNQSGPKSALLALKSPSGDTGLTYFPVCEFPDNHNTCVIETTFPTYTNHAEPGVWTLWQVRLYDKVSNTKLYRQEDLPQMWQQTQLFVKSIDDKGPPKLNSFSLSSNKIDPSSGAVKLQMKLSAEDDFAGLSFATVTFQPIQAPSGNRSLVTYCRFDKQLSASCSLNLDILPSDPRGDWLISVLLEDTIFSSRIYTSLDLANMDFPNRLIIGPNERISVSQNKIQFTSPVGSENLLSQTVSISRSETANFTSSSTQTAWLNIASNNAATPATLTVSVNPKGLAAGTHIGNITLSSDGVTGSPYTIPVTLTIIPVSTVLAMPPQVVDVSPFAGRGTRESFTVSYRDVNGWSSLQRAAFVLGVGTNPEANCWLEILPQTNQVRLRSDSGTNWLGPKSFGEVATLANSQCHLSLSQSTLTGNATDLTATLALYFFSTTKKNLWLLATDDKNLTSEWRNLGAWWAGEVWSQGYIKGQPTPRYRLFSTVTRTHLHTTDLNEYTVLGSVGWKQEGQTGWMLNAPATVNGVAAVPYYRIYKQLSRSHFWTADRNEYTTLIQLAGIYHGEGIDGLLLPQPVAGTMPLYRLVHKFENPVLHHWTTDSNEYTVLGGTGGWGQEGVAGYLLNTATTSGIIDQFPYTLLLVSTASRQADALTPGQVVSVMGEGAGEATVSVAGQVVPTKRISDREVQLTLPATLDANTPVTIMQAGQQTTLEPTVATHARPLVFTADHSGKGQAEAQDEQGQANTPDHPARRGALVQVLLSGSNADDTAGWHVTLGGYPAAVLGVRNADAGRQWLTVRVPQNAPSGAAVALLIQHGDTSYSQPGVTLAVE